VHQKEIAKRSKSRQVPVLLLTLEGVTFALVGDAGTKLTSLLIFSTFISHHPCCLAAFVLMFKLNEKCLDHFEFPVCLKVLLELASFDMSLSMHGFFFQ
jgi:hypothetical protein